MTADSSGSWGEIARPCEKAPQVVERVARDLPAEAGRAAANPEVSRSDTSGRFHLDLAIVLKVILIFIDFQIDIKNSDFH